MPASDGTAEPDFQAVLGGKGITVHSHRLWDDPNLGPAEHFSRMNDEIEPAARYLARLNVDVVTYCCTTGSFFKGPGWDDEMISIIEKASGAPAVATSPAVVDALRHLGAKKLSVITPYPDWNNQRLKPYMEAMGFEVLHVDGHPKTGSGEVLVCDHDPEEIMEFGVERCRPEADVLFCSCTDWRSMEVAERLEKLTGKPVVTSNQAGIWATLRKLGIDDPIDGYGSLLKNLTPATAQR